MQAAGGRALGRTVTIIALPALLGPILGPLIGGAILTHLSWRFMFWVNVPFCAAGLILAARFMPADKPGPEERHGRAWTWRASLCSPQASRRSSFGPEPTPAAPTASPTPMSSSRSRSVWRLPPPSPHTRCAWPGGTGSRSSTSGCSPRRPVASASAVLFFSGFSLYGAMLLLPLYYQEVRGVSPFTAGIMLVPQGVGALALARPGRLTDKIGAAPGRRRRLPHRRRLDRSLRPRRAAHLRVAARALPGHPRLRPRRGHYPRDGRRLSRPRQAADRPLERGHQDRPSNSAARSAPRSSPWSLSGAITARHGNLATGFDIAFWWATGFSAARRAALALAPWRFT